MIEDSNIPFGSFFMCIAAVEFLIYFLISGIRYTSNDNYYLLTGLLAFAMESQDIAAVFREENSTLLSQYSNNLILDI